MGSSRRSRGGRASITSPSASPNTSAHKRTLDSSADVTTAALDSTTIRLNIKDIGLLLATFIAAMGLSMGAGILASSVVSIFYDSQESRIVSSTTQVLPHPTAAESMVMVRGPPPASPRVTLMDGSIAIANRDDSRTAIYTSPKGRQSVVMVVQQSCSHVKPSCLQHVHEATNRTDENVMARKGRSIDPPRMDFEQWTHFHPTLCSDGKTIGFDDWRTLKAAIQDANAFSAERFVRWNEYFALVEFKGTFDDPSLYYEKDILFRVCPGATLRARRGPIFINAENVRIECEDCTIAVGGTHLSFGPYARDVVIRGINFRNAATSSLVLYHDGAEVHFEDCRWLDNNAVHNKVGNVADVNSTSIVHFHRCSVGKRTKAPPGFVSALSIRSS